MEYSDKKGYIKPPLNPHNEPYVDELNSLFESIDEHDDRSMVLTLAALCDDSLELLLLEYLREPKQSKELVNGYNAPLGTFSARIKAAFVLGLIINDSYKSLETLRKIRNKFAHNWSGISLDKEDVASLINQLSLTRRERQFGPEPKKSQLSDRDRLKEKIQDVLIGMRMLAKQIKRRELQAPILAGELKPVEVDIVVVEEFPDE